MQNTIKQKNSKVTSNKLEELREKSLDFFQTSLWAASDSDSFHDRTKDLLFYIEMIFGAKI